jgi:hypothetical protein
MTTRFHSPAAVAPSATALLGLLTRRTVAAVRAARRRARQRALARDAAGIPRILPMALPGAVPAAPRDGWGDRSRAA